MKTTSLFLALLFLSAFTAFSQERTINLTIESRNQAVSLMHQASQKIFDRDFESAIRLLITAVKTDSSLIDSYGLLYDASMYLNQSKPEAISAFQIGQRVYPDDDELCFYLGDLYRIAGKLQKAISEYTHAITLSKDQKTEPKLIHSYYFNRGTSYLKTKNYQAAIGDYLICLKQNPDDAFANLNIGNCYYNKKQIKEARIYWKKAADLGNSAAAEYYAKSAKMVH